MPFVKGQSGNPGGRKKVKTDIIELCQSLGPRAIEVLQEALEQGGYKERITAAKEILDRGFGRPNQAVQVSGEDGGPIVVRLLSSRTPDGK